MQLIQYGRPNLFGNDRDSILIKRIQKTKKPLDNSIFQEKLDELIQYNNDYTKIFIGFKEWLKKGSILTPKMVYLLIYRIEKHKITMPDIIINVRIDTEKYRNQIMEMTEIQIRRIIGYASDKQRSQILEIYEKRKT